MTPLSHPDEGPLERVGIVHVSLAEVAHRGPPVLELGLLLFRELGRRLGRRLGLHTRMQEAGGTKIKATRRRVAVAATKHRRQYVRTKKRDKNLSHVQINHPQIIHRSSTYHPPIIHRSSTYHPQIIYRSPRPGAAAVRCCAGSARLKHYRSIPGNTRAAVVYHADHTDQEYMIYLPSGGATVQQITRWERSVDDLLRGGKPPITMGVNIRKLYSLT